MQACTAQAAVNAEAQIIGAPGVSRAQLVPMSDVIETNRGGKPEKLSADAGDGSEPNRKALGKRGIDAPVATG